MFRAPQSPGDHRGSAGRCLSHTEVEFPGFPVPWAPPVHPCLNRALAPSPRVTVGPYCKDVLLGPTIPSQKSTSRSARGGFPSIPVPPSLVPRIAQLLPGTPGAQCRCCSSLQVQRSRDAAAPAGAGQGWCQSRPSAVGSCGRRCYVPASAASGGDSAGPGAGSGEAGSPGGPAAAPCSAARRCSSAGTSPT